MRKVMGGALEARVFVERDSTILQESVQGRALLLGEEEDVGRKVTALVQIPGRVLVHIIMELLVLLNVFTVEYRGDHCCCCRHTTILSLGDC